MSDLKKLLVFVEPLDAFQSTIVDIGNEAFGAYVRALMWQWQNESYVTEAVAPMIASPIIWELLIASGLVERRADGTLMAHQHRCGASCKFAQEPQSPK